MTIAKVLAYRDVHEFWHDTLKGDLPDIPLTINQIKQLIAQTGWEFTWKAYLSCIGKSAYDNMKHDFIMEPWKGTLRALAYTRGDKTGHCVVNSAISELEQENDIAYSYFTCYQNETYGVNVRHEVQASETMIMFILNSPRHTAQWHAWLFRLSCRTIERRRDPVWWRKRLEIINKHLKVLGQEPMQPPSGDGFNPSFMIELDERIDRAHGIFR